MTEKAAAEVLVVLKDKIKKLSSNSTITVNQMMTALDMAIADLKEENTSG